MTAGLSVVFLVPTFPRSLSPRRLFQTSGSIAEQFCYIGHPIPTCSEGFVRLRILGGNHYTKPGCACWLRVARAAQVTFSLTLLGLYFFHIMFQPTNYTLSSDSQITKPSPHTWRFMGVLCGPIRPLIWLTIIVALLVIPRLTTHETPSNAWVVVKIMLPFWVLVIIRHPLFRVPKKGP